MDSNSLRRESDGRAEGKATSRRTFLRRSVVAGAAVPALVASQAEAFPFFGRGDQLDARLPSLHFGSNARTFLSIQKHENDHVAFLKGALGGAARPKPTFKNLNQSDVFAFANLSQTFENTGVGAYLGAAPALNSKAYLSSAGSILTMEARHAGYLNLLLNTPISPNNTSFDAPLTAAQVAAGVAPYVASLNGGPALTYSTTPSDANDILILNFALALEYLEAEFYNINVPKFSS